MWRASFCRKTVRPACASVKPSGTVREGAGEHRHSSPKLVLANAIRNDKFHDNALSLKLRTVTQALRYTTRKKTVVRPRKGGL